jgi:hypothetical protein
MDILGRRPSNAVIAAFVIGAIFGLVVLGWYVFPVQWTGAGIPQLNSADQEYVLRNVAELYSFDGDSAKVERALSGWNGEVVACQMAATSGDPADAARLRAIANVVTGQECNNVDSSAASPAAEEGDGGSNLGLILALFLVFILLVGAVLVVIRRRNAMIAEDVGGRAYADVPELPPMTDDEGIEATPLARFRTTYLFEHDTYDDSFSIETATGEFLGECGVGISESIGTDTPKNVTAFEVWLFDKNDIRTVTKVIMSDHAFFDEALKAKLAPKGEPILARENETIVLETASLIINAEIREMQYGTGVLPPQSFFDRMSIELSAWAKEGDTVEPDIEGRVDELLEY